MYRIKFKSESTCGKSNDKRSYLHKNNFRLLVQIAFIFVVSHFAAGFSGSLTEGVGGVWQVRVGKLIFSFVCFSL